MYSFVSGFCRSAWCFWESSKLYGSAVPFYCQWHCTLWTHRRVYPFTRGWAWGCFQLHTMTNKALVNIRVQIFVCFPLLSKCLGVELQGHMLSVIELCKKLPHCVLKWPWNRFALPIACVRVSSSWWHLAFSSVIVSHSGWAYVSVMADYVSIFLCLWLCACLLLGRVCLSFARF